MTGQDPWTQRRLRLAAQMLLRLVQLLDLPPMLWQINLYGVQATQTARNCSRQETRAAYAAWLRWLGEQDTRVTVHPERTSGGIVYLSAIATMRSPDDLVADIAVSLRLSLILDSCAGCGELLPEDHPGGDDPLCAACTPPADPGTTATLPAVTE